MQALGYKYSTGTDSGIRRRQSSLVSHRRRQFRQRQFRDFLCSSSACKIIFLITAYLSSLARTVGFQLPSRASSQMRRF